MKLSSVSISNYCDSQKTHDFGGCFQQSSALVRASEVVPTGAECQAFATLLRLDVPPGKRMFSAFQHGDGCVSTMKMNHVNHFHINKCLDIICQSLMRMCIYGECVSLEASALHILQLRLQKFPTASQAHGRKRREVRHLGKGLSLCHGHGGHGGHGANGQLETIGSQDRNHGCW